MSSDILTSPAAKPGQVNWLAVFSFWLLVCAAFVLRTQLNADTTPLLSDTDDALRLVRVRDLLAGQSWFDSIQYRLNPPDGTPLHWSRLVDAPIAGLILILTPFLGDLAETAAVYAWPLILMGVLLALSAHLCVRLLGPEGLLPGVVLPALSATLIFQFSPGRIDHHNVQIVLTLLLASGVLGSWRSPLWAVAAGLAAAVSMAIGTETLPFVVMAIAVFGLIWIFAPEHGAATRSFGLSLGIGTVAVMVLTIAPEAWMQPACDALSVVYATAAVASGAALAAVPWLTDRLGSWSARFAVLAILGGAAVALVAILYPHCLGGPYAELDPWLRDNWLSRISEAKPVWVSIRDLPAYSIGIVIPPLISIAAIAVKLRIDPEDRPQWLILGALLAFAILVMVVQIRGARLAAILAVPGGAWVIVSARLRYLAKRSVGNVAGLVLAWLVYSGLAVALVVVNLFPAGAAGTGPTDVTGGEITKADCYMPENYDALRGLPVQLVMAPADLGAHILERTGLSVVGAPNHRNETGLRDTFRFFNGGETEAREILDKRGIDTVVLCTGLPELEGFQGADDRSIVTLLKQNRVPDWLEEIGDPDAVIRVFELRPPSPARFG